MVLLLILLKIYFVVSPLASRENRYIYFYYHLFTIYIFPVNIYKDFIQEIVPSPEEEYPMHKKSYIV